MKDQATLRTLADAFLDAWNSQDVERVLAVYTDDVTYVDPNTHGAVHGADGMRRYLTKLFAAWQMHWAVREIHPLGDRDGAALLWRATLRKAGSERAVQIDGMDLVLLRGDRLERNEVYFDRAALAPLLGLG